MTEEQFAENVEAVCRRPQMYTVSGTFGEAVSFLDGFGLGSNLETGTHSIWTPFCRWLADSRGNPSGLVTMVEFRTWYENDETALRELSRLYREFAVMR